MIKVIEQYTEELTLKEMKLSLGENKQYFKKSRRKTKKTRIAGL